MNLVTAFSLAGAMFVLAVTPGPGIFATVARSLASGFSQAAAVAAGIVCGDLFFLLLAVYGLSAVAGLLGNFFVVVKFLGGLYLIFLGLRTWFSPVRHKMMRPTREPGLSPAKNFSCGLAVTLGNPKVILFYLGFLPTFLDLKGLNNTDILLTAAIVCLVLGSVLLAYGYAADRARSFFTSRRSLKNLNHASGAIMIGAGSIILTRS
ncbi:MAG: LysE family translocator [Desulfobulbus sp.]|nr:MAG: LysE family translocator [Desulfobulbus sp.]